LSSAVCNGPVLHLCLHLKPLRCRAGEDGQLTRESNARFVKWSDGSESIMLGDEVLNVDRQVHARAHTYLYAVSVLLLRLPFQPYG
jgi:hypothetical protein